MAQAKLNGSLRIQDHDTYHDQREFNRSFTFNQWVPLSCSDAAMLDNFEAVYGHMSQVATTRNDGPFFFRNHPINYVVVCGWCIDMQPQGKSGPAVFVLDDGSGPTVSFSDFSRKPSYRTASPWLGKFFEVRGKLRWRPKFGIRIDIRDIIPHDASWASVMLMFNESIEVRHHILSKSWVLDSTEMLSEQTEDEPRNDSYILEEELPKESADPKLFCSLSRAPSQLIHHSSFRLQSQLSFAPLSPVLQVTSSPPIATPSRQTTTVSTEADYAADHVSSSISTSDTIYSVHDTLEGMSPAPLYLQPSDQKFPND